MEDRAKQRARIFTILGVILALAAGGGTYFYASQAQTAAPPVEEKTDVVVATRDLLPRQAVQASDVTIQKFPVSIAPPTAAKKADEVVGKVLVSPVSRGEPLTPIRWTVAQGQAAFTVLPPGTELKPDSPHYRALSITVPDANAVGGNIVPGDIVDIIATVSLDPNKFFTPTPPTPPDPNRVVDFQTKTIFEGVPILAKTATTYTIRVSDLVTAEKFYYLQSAGAQLAMVLRDAKDERVVPTQGTSFPNIYRDFSFKIVTRINP